MNAKSKLSERRLLRFHSLEEAYSDAEQIVGKPHRTLGKWTAAQILQHLSCGINLGFDGTTFKAPWLARAVIAPFMKNSFLTKPMSAGFQLPKSAGVLIPSPDIDLAGALAEFRRAVDRLKTETPDKPHPFLGKLTPEDFAQLQVRHAELHLSFIIPEKG